jgi:hypothetical protein
MGVLKPLEILIIWRFSGEGGVFSVFFLAQIDCEILWTCGPYSAKMSNGQPSQPEDSSVLRDRIVDILSPGSPSRGPSTDHNHGPGHGPSGEHMNDRFNETSRLLEDYDRRHSVCGLPDCNHGTFSPKPEQEPSSLAGSSLWGTRTPRFMASGLQTPATDGTSITNRLVAEMGLKNRRRMYALTPVCVDEFL